MIFRLYAFESPFNFDFVISFIFLLPFAFIFYIICSFFRGTSSHLLSVVLLGLIALIYSSQLIYYQFFRTIFSVYSVGNGAQILEFWKDIAKLFISQSIWILLLYLPVFLLIGFGKNQLSFEKINWFKRITLVCCIVLSQLLGIGAVYSSGTAQHSAYDLYFKSRSPMLSAERLGLITTMRLDFQRLISGWSPELIVPPHTPVTPPSQGVIDETPIEQENEKEEIEYNVMDIDFSELNANESNQVIKDMHKYFESVQPTAKNKYTGKYKDYNLILITAESFSPYAIHKDATPTLYKMVHEGYQFTNFYTPIWEVSTSDGEYVAVTGLIPTSGIWSFQESGKNALPFVLGNQLQKLDYKTLAYHNHTYTYYGRHISHPNLGYVYKGLGNGLDVKESWPESDLEMIEKTVPEYMNSQPFHTYYMTVSGHMQYSFTGNYIAWKNKKYVEDLPYSEQAKAYLATQIELDLALEHLLSQLENAGIADQTLIAISADHYPYGLEDQTIDELTGHAVEGNFELYKSPFILYAKGMDPEIITKPASSLDILPTLSNLMGVEYDSRLLMGQDIFSDSEPLVSFLNKSFITEKGRYNSITKEFITNAGEEVDEAYIEYISSVVQAKFYYSAKILETDYYRKVFGE